MNDPSEVCRALFATGGDLIFVIDASTHTIVTANVAARERSGYPAEELEGMSIERVLRADDEQAGDGESSSALRLDGLAGCATRLVAKSGALIPLCISTSDFDWRHRGCLLIIAAARLGDAHRIQPSATRQAEREEFPTIIGRSVKIRHVCQRIGSLARSDVTVLIQGETGTGKEVVANAVHAHSQRGRGPFVKVNCAGLTETLLESELFGHVKGSFTGAIRDRLGRFKQADGGTIFLDEIGSLSLAGQAKLLRVLQEREFEPVGSSLTIKVNVRVIAATNADLAKAVVEGKFREDLYYRLNVFPITLPPLRERKEDVGLLAMHFLRHYAPKFNKAIRTLAPEAIDLMVQHNWPGNVRELENAIEHALIVESGAAISPTSLPKHLIEAHPAEAKAGAGTEPRLREKLNLFERQVLIDTLARANGVKKRAATMLGIDARNLPYLLKKHHLNEGPRQGLSVH